MGFPRIVSKNNKIYTKLGEFCLSSDGTNFWILCHTCQEELQSQDHFWKHVQDEHNFLHIKPQESNSRATYMDCAESSILPLPLYRKIHSDSEDNVQRSEMDHDEEDDEHSQQPKDYTDMRNAINTTNAVAIDIKVEPPSASSNNNNNQGLSISTAAAAAQHQQATNLQLQSHNTTLYQLPSVVPPSSTAVSATYATIVHPATIAMPQPPQATIQQQELLVPKESNSTTASASSAVSSDDGERWYICEHESCGLKFKYQSRLELHRSVHSKERKFACEICGASFKQSCNLSTHRKKKHFLKGTKNLTILPQQQQPQQQQQQQPSQQQQQAQISQHHQQQLQQHTQPPQRF